jgi:transcriptional regulator with XRE-family HTH domain
MRKSRYTKRYDQLLAALRQARKNSGLTQTQVGRKFGAHASFVSKIESGERRIDVVELADLCHVYGISIPMLLQDAGIE